MKDFIRKLLRERLDPTLTLYHGTTKYNANLLLMNGWSPQGYKGANSGNSNYLYLTSEPEDAKWFANENGGDTVLTVSNIPISFLRPDPEDEAGFSMDDLLNRMKLNYMPSKFILTKLLPAKYFSM